MHETVNFEGAGPAVIVLSYCIGFAFRSAGTAFRAIFILLFLIFFMEINQFSNINPFTPLIL